MTHKKITPVEAGDAVRVVDEDRNEHVGIVTIVHGTFSADYVPCLNVAYTSSDPSKTDPYGRQIERLCSLQHFDYGPNRMPNPGRYWANL